MVGTPEDAHEANLLPSSVSCSGWRCRSPAMRKRRTTCPTGSIGIKYPAAGWGKPPDSPWVFRKNTASPGRLRISSFSRRPRIIFRIAPPATTCTLLWSFNWRCRSTARAPLMTSTCGPGTVTCFRARSGSSASTRWTTTGRHPPAQGRPPGYNHFWHDMCSQMITDVLGWTALGLLNTAAETSDFAAHIVNWGVGADGGVFIGAVQSEAFFTSEMAKLVRSARRFASRQPLRRDVDYLLQLRREQPDCRLASVAAWWSWRCCTARATSARRCGSGRNAAAIRMPVPPRSAKSWAPLDKLALEL